MQNYTINDAHLLQATRLPVYFKRSPNSGRELVAPALIVLHYTGGDSYEGAINWLTTKRPPDKASSAHLVIDDDREDRVAQLVPFNVRAWHVGPSSFNATADGGAYRYQSLNTHAIGIELVNPGWVQQRADGTWTTRVGTKVSQDRVILQKHRLASCPYRAWRDFPKHQVDTTVAVCEALIAKYPSIKFIVGHDEVALPVGRKIDPGPALDVQWISTRLFGRSTGEDV